MANDSEEAADIASFGGSLVINMGSATSAFCKNASAALAAYNAVGGPVVFDPVGAGATKVRRQTMTVLLEAGYMDVVKGNEKEILAIHNKDEVKQRGVDSGASTKTEKEKAQIVKSLAKRIHNVVVMTGKTDYLSDGKRTYALGNGHQYLTQITASGCTLGTTIAACLAVERKDKLSAALAGCILYEVCAEIAAKRKDVLGPGTFIPAFLDTLSDITHKNMKSKDTSWVNQAKLSVLDV